MSNEIYRDMMELTAAVRAAAETRFQAIASEETSLRAELAKLDVEQREARTVPSDTLHALRGIGGEMLWQGWVARARRELQIRLARVLARKAMALRDLRREHGRSEAAQALQALEKSRLRRLQERKRFQRDQEMLVLREISSKNR